MKRSVTFTILLFFICQQGYSQQEIFVNDDGGGLYSLDPTNCSSNRIGFTSVIFTDIAFTSDGRLWGTNSLSLYEINPTNAATTYVGQSEGTESVSLVGLNDSTLLSEVNDSLYGINVSNGQSYNIGNIGYDACGDLSWYNGALYMSGYNQLIKIVLNRTNTAILSSTPVNSMNYPIPCFLGLAREYFTKSDNLIGFAYLSAYSVSTSDGTYQLLCSPIVHSPFGITGAASIFLNVFPVNLLEFSYTLDNKTVKLQWETASEINGNYFLIQKSADGVKFSTIGKEISADVSNSEKQYVFQDNDPVNVNYYRLAEVDLSGKSSYSNTLLVKLPQSSALNIIQNPVQNMLQVQVNSGEPKTNYLVVYDCSGRRLKTANVSNGLQTIDISTLPSGTYILQLITSDGQICNERFVKSN